MISGTQGKRSGQGKVQTPSPTALSPSPAPSNSARFIPKTKLYIELSESPTPYDLKGKSLAKDIEHARNLINYEDLENKKTRAKKDYKLLTKKDIKKASDEREDFFELGLDFKEPHKMAKDFFDHVKKGAEGKVAEMLKEVPQMVKEVDSTGQTALHWAVRRKFLNLVKILIFAGASVMVKDMVGRRPEDIARHKKFNEIGELLIAARRRTANVSKIFISNDQRGANPMATLMNMRTRRTVNNLNFTVL